MVFWMIYILEVYRYRVLAWLVIVDIAYSMRAEINLSILLIGDLVLALVQTDSILDEEQDFLG